MKGSLRFNVLNITKTLINVFVVIAQLFIIFGVIFKLFHYADYAYRIFQLCSVLFALYVITTEGKVSFKFSWVIFILALPICGMVFYLLWGKMRLPRKMVANAKIAFDNSCDMLTQDENVLNEIDDENVLRHVELLQKMNEFPIYKNTYTKYLEIGEIYFSAVLEELKKAKKFIFIEFFIIAEGRMKDSIMDILFEKAAEGVEIKIMYDKAGSTGVAPKNFVKTCAHHGIKCAPHNPFSFSFFSYINYRDHRKIIVIDGDVAFTGGINIGDEYINEHEKLGHWKDTGVLLCGDAVHSFTMMFLRMWASVTGEKCDYASYKTCTTCSNAEGFVMPYGDGPIYKGSVAENNYVHIIASAKRYVYITTPYLIIDSDIISALCLASASGVDVRIITPHVADNPIVHAVTRSFYGELLQSGVKIYEYTPGFIHAKSIVSDDRVCSIGSANFDYRSLYWNYECGVYMVENQTVFDLKCDFLKTVSISQEIKLIDWQRKNIFIKMWHAFLRIVSPLI